MIFEKKKVTKTGNSSHILLHKDLIDKDLYVIDDEMLKLLRGMK
jgi:putative transposon-encoded protein